jgi:hypothetical protein
MKLIRIYIPVICMIITWSCKKFIDDQKKEAAIDFITSGQWIVQSFYVDSTSVTADFEGYTFTFYDNGTVTGIRSGSMEDGTWISDVPSRTITSDFPGASEPLVKLNGVWTLKDGGNDFVKAERIATSATMHLELKKTP